MSENLDHLGTTRYESHGPAAWIVLDRPQKRNALSPHLITRLANDLGRAERDPKVRAVVLAATGSAFCAGADLEAGADVAKDPAQGEPQEDEADRPDAPRTDSLRASTERLNPFAELLLRIRHLSKPVIAAVQGPAFGGGLGLVAAADIAIASENAIFSFSEARLGLIPAMISVVVLPKIGAHHAGRLFLGGRRFPARDALDYGLLHRVTPEADLAAAVAEEVDDIARCAPRAVAEAKSLIRDIPLLPERQAMAEAAARFEARLRSEEAAEGLAAFTEKRRPSWSP